MEDKVNKRKFVTNEDIKELISTRRSTYLKDPLQIVVDYNNEKKVTVDYSGRQLLEMIQNANDECENTEKEKKIFIKLEGDTLLIANNGNPFTKGGVESLMYSDLSPKVNNENMVGQKGLGFRSILDWAKEIYISSYDLNIRFSRAYAKKFLDDLINDETNNNIQHRLNEKIPSEKYPISTLRCPVLEDDKSLKKIPEYDTVIELTLNKGQKKNIRKQIKKEVRPEIIVFLEKVKEIEVQTKELHYSIRKISDGEDVIIEKEDYLTKKTKRRIWKILDDCGELKGKKGKFKKYELKIAFNPKIVPKRQKLYSYFRTKIDFPFPVLAHGTFELTPNRNDLSDDENGFNKILLKKLAKLLIQCSINITKGQESNYSALKLLLPSKTYSSLFGEDWKFDNILRKNIKNSKIFPAINNEYLSLNDNPKFYNVNIEKIIPIDYYKSYNQLLKYTEDEIVLKYLDSIENVESKYSDDEFTDKINEIIFNSGLTAKHRIDWINIICENKEYFYLKEEAVLPKLLINNDNEIIDSDDEVVLPAKDNRYKFPENIKLQFLQYELSNSLKERVGDTRDLSNHLKPFGVVEYSESVVARKIISGTHNLLKFREDKALLVSEMHEALFQIFNNQRDKLDDDFFNTLKAPYLISKKGKLVTANKLYFGKGYNNGFLNEGLFKGINDDIFIGSIKQNNLQNIDKYYVEKYLEWIGVASMPRIKIKKVHSDNTNEAYVKHIFENIVFPYSLPFDNHSFKSKDEIYRTNNIDYKVLWYEYFDKIIENASFEHLLVWFLTNKDINSSITTDIEYQDSYFKFLFDYKVNQRNLAKTDIKSYILFKLKKKSFIPVEGAMKSLPNESILTSNNLAPLVKSPKINIDAKIFRRYRIKEDQINLVLSRLGVKKSFKDLSINMLYTLLNKHKNVYGHEFSKASNLYSAIIDATTNRRELLKNDVVERQKFLNDGEILVKMDGKKQYARIEESTYVDNPNHSQDLLSKLKVARIQSRTGNTRVEELFGIKPIDRLEFIVKDIEENKGLNEWFINELVSLKPLLFVFRHKKSLSKTQYSKELSSLKSLKIRTCHSLKISYELNNQVNSIKLKKYEYIFNSERKTYFIKLDKKTTNYEVLKQELRFKETVADIISGALKVNEHRKDFIILLGERKENWKSVLAREFNDFDELEKEVIKKFEGLLTSEQNFWKSIFNIKRVRIDEKELDDKRTIHSKLRINIDFDDFFELCRSIEYNQLSKSENLVHLHRLFNMVTIELIDFNSESVYNISFLEYWRDKLREERERLLPQYSSFLYAKGYDDSFAKNIEIFRDISFEDEEVEDRINVNVENLFIKILDKKYGIDISLISDLQDINIEKIYRENLNNLKEILKTENIYDERIFQFKMYETKVRSQVYFNKVNDLLDVFRSSYLNDDEDNMKVELGNNSKGISVTDIDALSRKIEEHVSSSDLKIEDYNPTRAEESDPMRKRNSGGQTSNNFNNKLPKAEIGFIGEKYAEIMLKKEYDKVIWKSENALKAGYPEGKDGYGYDFECIKDGETRYVEVKSTTTLNNIFYISGPEVKQGHSRPDKYDILLITGLLSNNIEFKYLKNIFKYTDNNSFVRNEKFLVENDSFKIKFK